MLYRHTPGCRHVSTGGRVRRWRRRICINDRGHHGPHLWARRHVALLEVTLPLFKPWAGVEPERCTRREVPRPHKPLVALLVPPLSNTRCTASRPTATREDPRRAAEQTQQRPRLPLVLAMSIRCVYARGYECSIGPAWVARARAEPRLRPEARLRRLLRSRQAAPVRAGVRHAGQIGQRRQGDARRGGARPDLNASATPSPRSGGARSRNG